MWASIPWSWRLRFSETASIRRLRSCARLLVISSSYLAAGPGGPDRLLLSSGHGRIMSTAPAGAASSASRAGAELASARPPSAVGDLVVIVASLVRHGAGPKRLDVDRQWLRERHRDCPLLAVVCARVTKESDQPSLVRRTLPSRR